MKKVKTIKTSSSDVGHFLDSISRDFDGEIEWSNFEWTVSGTPEALVFIHEAVESHQRHLLGRQRQKFARFASSVEKLIYN